MNKIRINQNEHPSKDIIASLGTELLNKKIVLVYNWKRSGIQGDRFGTASYEIWALKFIL